MVYMYSIYYIYIVLNAYDMPTSYVDMCIYT